MKEYFCTAVGLIGGAIARPVRRLGRGAADVDHLHGGGLHHRSDCGRGFPCLAENQDRHAGEQGGVEGPVPQGHEPADRTGGVPDWMP